MQQQTCTKCFQNKLSYLARRIIIKNMRNLLIIILALVFCTSSSYAQKRKKAKPAEKKEVVVIEKTPQELLYEELLPSTAKVMFIDSVVVDKNSFLSQLPLSNDMGNISITGERTSFTNEFDNTCIFASGDSISGRHLYMTHRYGEKWDEPSLLSELNQQGHDFPFLMPDGITLYFSAEGEGTVGGRDIFRSTYNAEDSHFYEATNMGMPFNSPANEYLLVISDMENLGWLVSDRYQPEGKVCIYTFEPTAQRETFGEDADEEILKHYAGIESIKDTWKFGNRNAAIQRRNDLLSRLTDKKADESIEFVINDITTYTSLADFKTPNGKQKYQDILKNKNKLAQLKNLLETSRDGYANTNKSKRHDLGRKILALEQEVETLETNIEKAEKELRNAENR